MLAGSRFAPQSAIRMIRFAFVVGNQVTVSAQRQLRGRSTSRSESLNFRR
jgi:hypothetical protein